MSFSTIAIAERCNCEHVLQKSKPWAINNKTDEKSVSSAIAKVANLANKHDSRRKTRIQSQSLSELQTVESAESNEIEKESNNQRKKRAGAITKIKGD